MVTYGQLKEIFESNQIPEDTVLMSDSGWECDATHMDGIFYNKEKGVIVFTQDEFIDKCYKEAPWKRIK